jgi:hypothetical protein
MDFPSLMPKELAIYLDHPTEDALFLSLIKQPNDLVLFFETATDDETWTENHEALMIKLMEWLTQQTFQDRLTLKNYMMAARAIQKHYLIVKSMVPKNITIKLKDAEIPFNGMLLTAASDFFKQLLIQASIKNSTELSFPQISANAFSPIGFYLCTGNVPDLKTRGSEEIIDLIKRANAWELAGLSVMSEQTLKKYINSENVFEMLARAKSEHWPYFEQRCIDFINSRDWNFKLSIPANERLSFEFLDFHEPTVNSFEELRPLITDIVCSGNLIEESQFGLVLRECPHLFSLDISRTNAFSDQLLEIPKDLQALNLSECLWITKDSLKKIMGVCPDLKQLVLQKNEQMNYIFWGDLAKYKHLLRLDLANCDQLQDSDLSILFRGLNALTELSLSGCKKISERGFLELAKSLSRLIKLDLSYSNISDTALVEIISRCKNLTSLNVSSCSQLSEKGILAAVKTGLSLQRLDIAHCHIAEEAIQEITKTYPQLILVSSS